MRKHFHFFLLSILLSLSSTDASARILKLCVGEGEWWPFTMNNMTGMHFDIVNEAARGLGWKVTWKLTAWNRCLVGTGKGLFDGALSAGYSKERSETMHFPEGAEREGCDTIGMLDCEPTAILVSADSKYEYKGDLKTLPQPIRIALGYVQIAKFEAEKIKLDIAPTDRQNVLKLVRDQAGSVLITGELAIYHTTRTKYKDKIRRLKANFDDGASYLAISKKSTLTDDERQRLYRELSKISGSKKKIEKIRKPYFDNPPPGL